MISIDGYTDFERIGQGGLGDVYRATQQSTGGTVAIKILRDVSDESLAWHRTRRELTALVSLAGHANVIQLLEVLDSPDGPALVMEFAPGGSVADLMVRRDGPLTVGETVLVGRHTATALVAAHERGIVHRDVKPQNLLIDAYGQVKLCDFGIAAMARSEEFQERTSAISMRYASPEDLDADVEVGPASDVYSLGATLLHLARGAPPTLKERLAPWEPPSTADDALAALDAVVAACLHPEPELRPSAAQVADDLERVAWSIDERNQSIAVESSDSRPEDEAMRNSTVAAVIAALDADAHTDDTTTVPRAEPAAGQRCAAGADSGDTVHRRDLQPDQPEVSGRRRSWLLIGGAVAVVTAVLAIAFWPIGDDASGVVVVERPTPLVDIREVDWPIGEVGECLVQRGDMLESVPCGQAHDLQRFAVGELRTLPEGFDATGVEAAARSACDAAFEVFVGVSVEASDLQVAIGAPSPDSWEQDGDRTYQCLLGVAGQRIVGDAEFSRH